MKTITILVPCYNEAATLPLLRTELEKLMQAESSYAWQVLAVDDGSTDGTADVLRQWASADSRLHWLRLSRNFGKEAALLAGLDRAHTDAVVIMDADLQHPVGAVPAMLRLWEQGVHDVYGRRQSREGDSWLRRRLTNAFYRLLAQTSDVDVTAGAGDFRLLDRRCVQALRQMRERGRYTKGMFDWMGFQKAEVVYAVDDRATGTSKMSYGRLLRLAAEALVSHTTAPLLAAALLGLVVSLLAVVYACVVLTKTLLWGDPVAGYPTLVITILLLGGVQLFALGIVGAYVGHIVREVKGRPVYIVEEENEKR